MPAPGECCVRIRYVDGVEIAAPFARWREVRADGVDWFEVVAKTGVTRFAGKSLYWLYERDGAWCAGGCGLGYDSNSHGVIGELMIKGGEQRVRLLSSVPDLMHAEAKLGWWRPGAERP